MPAKRAPRFQLVKDVFREPKSAAPNEDERDVPGPGSLPAGNSTHEPIILHRNVEKLHTLTSKLENSGGVFIKARKHLDEIVATDGNTELQSFFLTTGSVDWKTELARNRHLTSRAELQSKERGSSQSLYKDGAMTGSSYEFLKSILG